MDWERSERSRSTAIQDGMQQWTCTHGSCIPLPRLIQSHWRPSIARALVVVILVTAVTYGGHPSAHFGDVETPWAESDRSSDVLHLQYPIVRLTYFEQNNYQLNQWPIWWRFKFQQINFHTITLFHFRISNYAYNSSFVVLARRGKTSPTAAIRILILQFSAE